MCNCSKTKSCNKCSTGLPCNCPPDFSLNVIEVSTRQCCPPGSTGYKGPTANYPYGYCIDSTTFLPVAAIECNTCEDMVTTDCVYYDCTFDASKASDISPCSLTCSGVVPGDSLTTILRKLCPTTKANIMAVIQAIALDQDLYNGFCNLVAGCGSTPGLSTPVIGEISWTIP